MGETAVSDVCTKKQLVSTCGASNEPNTHRNQRTHTPCQWSADVDAALQACFASTDWNMFRDSSNGIEEYTTSVTGVINKCICDVVPTVTVRTYPNQKPWITGNICT